MDKNEFIALIFPLKERLFRIAWQVIRNKEEAEDIVQEVMLKIWKIEVSDIGCMEAYCYTMVRNLALNHLNLKDNRNIGLALEHDGILYTGPLEKIEEKEKLELLHQAIIGLPGLQQDIVQLRDIEGLSYLEIARTLEITEEQVKINLFRARKKIKEILLKIENYGL